jgi:hypothetical protein
VSPLELAAPVGAMAGQLQVARWLAAAAFVSLLFLLGFGLLRAKRQVLQDDADAALEADFLRLERELAADDPARRTLPGRALE